MQSALPLRHYDDGGKILGVPIGALPSSLAWIEAHFAAKAPPMRTLGNLQKRTSVTLLKYSYNSRMQYLRKTLPETFIGTGIFSTFDDKIDDALLNTGISDDREELRVLRCLPIDKGGLSMPLLAGHHGERHHFTTAMRTKEYLKFYYPSFVHDHTITFNVRDIDLEGTPPDDLQDFLHQLRERAPEEDQMSTFTLRLAVYTPKGSTQALLPPSTSDWSRQAGLTTPQSFSVFRAVNLHSSSTLVAPAPLIPNSPTRNTLQRCDRTSLLQSAGGSKGRPSVAAVPPTR